MPRRTDIAERLPFVFGLNRAEAAAAIGVSAPTFDELVKAGHMPKPRLAKSRKIWDVDELRAAFKSLPQSGEPTGVNTWDDVA